MSLKEIIYSATCNDLHVVINCAGSKYIIFTRCESDIFIICSSDGYDVWRLEIDKNDFDAMTEIAGLSTEGYLSSLR